MLKRTIHVSLGLLRIQGVISPLMALNDDLCSNAYCLLQISLRSILCAGQPLRAPQRVPRSNTSWRSQIGTKWKTNSHQRWLTVMVLRSILWSTLMDNPLSIGLRFRPVERSRESRGKAGFGFFRRRALLAHSIPFLVCSIKTQV